MFRKRSVSSKTTYSAQRGFSMIEMGVVLLVIAIIAAFVIPQVVVYMRLYKLGVAARDVATALQRARFLATSDNRRAGIVIREINLIEIEEYDPEGVAEPVKKGSVILPQGIIVSDDAPKQIAFDGRGVVTPLPKESPSIRVIGFFGYSTMVVVSPTGQVSISDAKKDDA